MVSWTTYFSAVSIFLAIYYGFVLLVYYRKELLGKIKPAPAKLHSSVSSLQVEQVEVPANQSGFQPTSLIDEIHAYMNQVAEQLPVTQEEVVIGVKTILQKYPSIEDSFLRLSINDLVVSLAESKCYVEISPEVLHRLWS